MVQLEQWVTRGRGVEIGEADMELYPSSDVLVDYVGGRVMTRTQALKQFSSSSSSSSSFCSSSSSSFSPPPPLDPAVEGDRKQNHEQAGGNNNRISRRVTVQGGILADQVGLGKTLTCIALIIAHPCPNRHTEANNTMDTEENNGNSSNTNISTDNTDSPSNTSWYGIRQGPNVDKMSSAAVAHAIEGLGLVQTTFTAGKKQLKEYLSAKGLLPVQSPCSKRRDLFFSGATLVVVPARLVTQWEQQILRFLKPLSLGLCTVTGPGDLMKLRFRDCLQADVVVVASNLLSDQKHLPQCKLGDTAVLSQVHWRRLIVDEAHEIECLVSALNIPSDYRWYVSGTPFPGTLELGLALQFLQMKIGGIAVCPGESRADKSWRDSCNDRLRSENLARHPRAPHRHWLIKPPPRNLQWLFSPLGGVVNQCVHQHFFARSTNDSVGGENYLNDHENVFVEMGQDRYFLMEIAVADFLRQCTLSESLYLTARCSLKLVEWKDIHKPIVDHRVDYEYLSIDSRRYSWFPRGDAEIKDDTALPFPLLIRKAVCSIRYQLQNLLTVIANVKQKISNLDSYRLDNLRSWLVDAEIFKGKISSHLQALESQLKELALAKLLPRNTVIRHGNSERIMEVMDKTGQDDEPLVMEFGTRVVTIAKYVRQVLAADSDARVLVFSRYAALLTLIRAALDRMGIGAYQLEHTTTSRGFDKVLQGFQEPASSGQTAPPTNTPRVLLLSLSTSASGTNLAKVTHICLTDHTENAENAPGHIAGSSNGAVSLHLDSIVASEIQAVGRAVRQCRLDGRTVMVARFVDQTTSKFGQISKPSE